MSEQSPSRPEFAVALTQRRRAGAVLLALALVAASWGIAAGSARHAPAQAAGITASGFIEADEVAVSSELGGRITALRAPEGAEVRAGSPLVELDRGIATAELRVAQAKAQTARAQLAQVKAGARPEDIRQAEAAVALAEANRQAADQARQDARMLLANPQSLDLQIIQTRAQIEIDQGQLDAAVKAQNAAQLVKDRFDVAGQDYVNWQAWIGVNAAGATVDGAGALLAKLEEERRASTALRAQVDAADSAYQSAVSAVAQAQARLADLRAGATAEQVGVAEAQVRIADAGVAAAQARLDKLTLVAPSAGEVIAHNLKAGELAAPGTTILTLANLDTLTLVVYVPADKLGLVSLGARVPLQVEGFANRAFEGEVTHIADKAEFIPNNVQSADDRAALVFAVKLRLANPDHALKPGLPADAQFPAR